MTFLQKLSLVAIVTPATLSVAASIPSKTILPDNVVRCEPTTGCTTKVLYGHNYKVINTPRFTVMVAISHEGSYTRADISVTNKTDMPLAVTPDDFRVEVLTPKPKVLLYIPPANLVLRTPPPTLTAAPATSPAALQTPTTQSGPAESDANPAPPASEPEVLSLPVQQKSSQEDVQKAAAEQHLAATSIPPNEATSGRVYFERDRRARLVNVVLPIAGLVFEFPYAMK